MLDQDILNLIKSFKSFFLKKIWVVVVLLFLMIYFFYKKADKVQENYSSFTTFMLADEDMSSASGSGTLGLAAQLGLVGGNSGSNKNMLRELMGSRKIIEHTLFYEITLNNKKDLLVNHYIELNNQKNNSKNDKFFSKNYKVGENEEMDTWLASLANEIKLNCSTKITDAGLFEIFYSHFNERFTKLFLETHTQSISDYYIEKKTKKNSEIVKFAQKRVDSLSAVMSGKERNRASSIDQNMLSVFSVNKVNEVSASRNLQVVSGIYTEAVASLEMAKLSLNKATPLIQVVDDVRFPLNKTEKPFKKNIIIGSIIGLVLGLIIIVIWFALKNFKLVINYIKKMQEKSKSENKPNAEIDF